MLLQEHAKRAASNSRASNIPGELLVAIESVEFLLRVFRVGKTASKDRCAYRYVTSSIFYFGSMYFMRCKKWFPTPGGPSNGA